MNDIIEHETIRRENPVYNFPIEIVHEDDQLLIINKPPSIPVTFFIDFFLKLKIIRFMSVDIILLIQSWGS